MQKDQQGQDNRSKALLKPIARGKKHTKNIKTSFGSIPYRPTKPKAELSQ
jgi:hypothetical protein